MKMSPKDRPARRESAPINWRTLACFLAEAAGHPLLLVDRCGVVRCVSPAASEALGWSREDLEDRDVGEALAPPGRAECLRSWVQQALVETVLRHACEVMSGDGRRLEISLDARPVGAERERCVVVAIRSVREVTAEARSRAYGELSYEVSLNPAEFGRLVRPPEAGPRAFGVAAKPCHEVVYGLSSPCIDCPVRAPEGDPWPRVVVRRAAGSTEYRLVRAHRVSPDLALVTVNMLPEASVSALNEAKIRHLAEQAGLTERERGVLAWLLLGRSLDEIAVSLGISARTVKFHQQNILNKLGADSRVDLIRLVF